MRQILMSNVTFSMEHANGNASISVPVWYAMLYSSTAFIWPGVAIYLMLK